VFGGFFILFLPDLFLYMHVHIFNCAVCTVQCVFMQLTFCGFCSVVQCKAIVRPFISYSVHIAPSTMAEMKKIPILNAFLIRLVRL
jgi:hypothetical protein